MLPAPASPPWISQWEAARVRLPFVPNTGAVLAQTMQLVSSACTLELGVQKISRVPVFWAKVQLVNTGVTWESAGDRFTSRSLVLPCCRNTLFSTRVALTPEEYAKSSNAQPFARKAQRAIVELHWPL